MPNHISNIVHIEVSKENWKQGEEAMKAIREFMKSDESPFDFNKLIPYPEEFEKLDKAREAARAAGVKWDKLPKDGFNQGGYEWCSKNWGTKWNAYEIGFDYDTIAFQTAWATPRPIWKALSAKFPDVTIMIEYADEDRGNNCGILRCRSGVIYHEDNLSGKPAGRIFARAVIAEQEKLAAERELDLMRAAKTEEAKKSE